MSSISNDSLTFAGGFELDSWRGLGDDLFFVCLEPLLVLDPLLLAFETLELLEPLDPFELIERTEPMELLEEYPDDGFLGLDIRAF